MHKKGSSPLYSLSSLLAKEQFRMKSHTFLQSAVFEKVDDPTLTVPKSAPNMEVWKANASSFVDAEMKNFFNEVVVVKIDAKPKTWKRLSKTEGQEALAFALARSSHENASTKQMRAKIKQETLRSFVSSSAADIKINKHMSAKNIGDAENMLFLIKMRAKGAQNFAAASFGLSQAGNQEVQSWKETADKLEKKLRAQGRFESLAVAADPMKIGTIVIDEEKYGQPIYVRVDGSMSLSYSTSSTTSSTSPRRSDDDCDRCDNGRAMIDECSEGGTQTTIVINDDGVCLVDPDDNEFDEFDGCGNEGSCRIRRRRSVDYFNSESVGSPLPPSSGEESEEEMITPPSAYAAPAPTSDLRCHRCNGKKQNSKHTHCHRCRNANGPSPCHHHTYHSGCGYCRWRRAQSPNGYNERMEKMRQQAMKDREAYQAKVKQMVANDLALRPGGPRPAYHNADGCSSCGTPKQSGCGAGSCSVTRRGCEDGACPVDQGGCKVERGRCDPGKCKVRPACGPCETKPEQCAPWKKAPACPSPCKPEPPCEVACEEPCKPACPPPVPDCYYFEDDETSSSSDDFCELLEDKRANQSNEEDEGEQKELFGIDTLTETGLSVDRLAGMSADEAETHRFAESVMVGKEEMAFLWGGKTKLTVQTLDPVFPRDTVLSLGNDRSYTAQLALQMARDLDKAPDLDVGRLNSDGTTLNTSRVQILSKREGEGIFTKLKNLFAGPILNRRLDERLAPIRDNSGNMRRGVRVFAQLNRATSSSRVATKAQFLESKKIVAGDGTSVPAYSGASFQLNVQAPTGESKQDMYFLRMDTDTPSRLVAASRRASSALSGNVWYRAETSNRAGIIMRFTRSQDPSKSVLESLYIVLSEKLMSARNYTATFEQADRAKKGDYFDADGDGEFDVVEGADE